MGRAVYDVSGGIFFPVFHGEEQRAVKAGIEGAGFGGAEVYEFAVDGNASERLVPDAVALGLHSVEAGAGHLALQVEFCLFRTDVRRCHTGVDLLAAMRLETDHGKGVEAFGLQTAVLRYLVGILSFLDGGAEIGVGIFEGFVKFDDEILAESLLYASGVAGGIAAYHAALGNDFHHRAALVGIDTHIALRFGESEAEDAGAVGGGKLCGDVVVGQVDAVVMRKCYFGLVGKPRCACPFVGYGFAGHGHE